MKVQCAVSDTAQISITRHVMLRTSGPNSSPIFGAGWPFRASVHSSVSGTALRIHSVMNAGRMPTRKIHCGGCPFSNAPARQASSTPQFTALCSVAAIHGRHFFGHVSESKRRAHRPLAADAQRGQKTEHHQMPPLLREKRQPGEAGVRQNRQHQRPAAPEQIRHPPEEPAAQRPAHENAAWMIDAFFPTSGSLSPVISNCATNAVATSV